MSYIVKSWIGWTSIVVFVTRLMKQVNAICSEPHRIVDGINPVVCSRILFRPDRTFDAIGLDDVKIIAPIERMAVGTRLSGRLSATFFTSIRNVVVPRLRTSTALLQTGVLAMARNYLMST